MAQVLVLGGGFGGLAAAHRLREALPEDAEVVVLDRHDGFAMGFAKLWDLSGQRPLGEGTRSRQALQRRGITFVREQVTGIDARARSVTTDRGTLTADGIVVALGTRPAPGHRALLDGPDAHDLYDSSALPAMREALDGVSRGRVVVSILGGPFKCPPAPYEAALIVDGILRRRGVRDDVEVVITTPQPVTLPVAGVDASAYVAGHLGDHDVELRAGHVVSGVDHAGRRLRFADGLPDLSFDVLLGVPADAPLEVVASCGVADADGWLRPDPRTFATDAPAVYAVGDCTIVPTATAQLPHAGVFAASQGEVAATNLAAELGFGSARAFDGRGACFLELPDELVALVEGDFYADPPAVTLRPADREQFERKQAFERDRLDAWLG